MNYETLKVERKEGTCVLTLSRPKALNALNGQLMSELDQFLQGIAGDKDVRVLILTGEGEKAFVAGGDISEFQGLDARTAEDLSEKGHRTLARLESLPIPTIAAVNGFALGGGLELALACDFIYASETASFGLPEVSLGLIPGYGGTLRLSRAVGLPMAKELIFSGRRVKADEALRIGLANKVVPAAQLLDACLATAREIMTRAPVAIGLAKKSIQDSVTLTLKEGAEKEAKYFAATFKTQDQAEGVKAFLEKRAPLFTGE